MMMMNIDLKTVEWRRRGHIQEIGEYFLALGFAYPLLYSLQSREHTILPNPTPLMAP